MRSYRIAAIPADGIGPEVIEAVIQAIRCAANEFTRSAHGR